MGTACGKDRKQKVKAGSREPEDPGSRTASRQEAMRKEVNADEMDAREKKLAGSFVCSHGLGAEYDGVCFGKSEDYAG